MAKAEWGLLPCGKVVAATLALLVVLANSAASAQKSYGPGASDTEIRIGQTAPYSGPASAYAIIGRIFGAYFNMVNEERGGVNGRKVTFISYDDGFSPPKTVEQTRKLVEADEVLAVAGSVGSATNLAVAKYLNSKKVPQILALSASPRLDDPATLPWTTTFYSSSIVESRIYAQYLLREKPGGKIAILYQNDDFGKGFLSGMKAELGSNATMVVAEASYSLTDPTVESQVVTLKASGADVLFIAASPKFAAQIIRRTYELAWRPMEIVVTAANETETVLKPAGLDASKDLVTSLWIKQAKDPSWDADPAMKEFRAFFAKWMPGTTADDAVSVFAYSAAQMLDEILRRCGDDLTRENLIKQATNITGFQLPLFLPGVTVSVSPTSRLGWRQAQLARFDGTSWVRFGDVVTIPEGATRE